tara:strand:- start:278 stop:1057 length:780 start_codon:yes stop_codon:yes gene_type:complete
MANYTITRRQEAGHVYGCTEFATTQEGGQIASPGGQLDSTIQWNIQADSGYVLDVNDFIVPGTSYSGAIIPMPINPPTTVYNTGFPAPILGAMFEGYNDDLIVVTLFLSPNPGIGISGANFVMPSSPVDLSVTIEGCAKVKGEGVHLRLIEPEDPFTTTEITIPEERQQYIASNTLDDGAQRVSGVLEPTEDGAEFERENFIMSYSVRAANGFRYVYPPTLDFNDVDYYYTFTLEYKDSLFEGRSQDVCGVVFDIFKKL